MSQHSRPPGSSLYPELLPVLQELRRVLKPGGTLRLSLPDLLKGIAAYERNDTEYFLIPDEDAKRIGAKLVLQLIWYGYSRTFFTKDFIEEQLYKAGYSEVRHCDYKQTLAVMMNSPNWKTARRKASTWRR